MGDGPASGATNMNDHSYETNIPADHPRAQSLRVRERMKQAVEAGLVHMTGLIAHGRGEAFDYLLGETTPPEAEAAAAEAVRLLRGARRPVLSLNGNVVALAAKECVALQEAMPTLRMEVNLFHRTPERVARLVTAMEAAGASPGSVLGADPDARIPGLRSDRALCCKAGIGDADVVLVPLEDGDRCHALKAMGKTVVTIDLNPLSRTARAAHVTIVDELLRALHHMAEVARTAPADPRDAAALPYDNDAVLAAVRRRMAQRLDDAGR